MMIMNAAKFGFFYAMIEYQDKHPDIELIKNYIHLDLAFKNHRVAIVCVPYGNVSELLKNFDFIQLTEWKWNFNFHEFSHDKNDTFNGWGNYKGPDLLSKSTRIDEYVHWDLETSYKDEFSLNEIEILKNLSKSNTLSLRSLDLLSDKQSSGGIRHHLANFAENGIFQLYPHVAHLGLKDIIFVKIYCKDMEFYKSLQHNFLSFPESHIFTNDKENLIIGYFHLPSNLTNIVTDQLNLLTLLLGNNIELEYELLPKDKMLRKFIELSKFNFAVRHGSAFTVD
ncbi:MAG: hypothetical protein HeimC3_51160 [Candidatus Heimdallarchaeota archaeon LC_3]|nr:MAG: hypothetical protein HeimC3_51160 [Candidatus Heimdallarchaeota archaeon LC_3]